MSLPPQMVSGGLGALVLYLGQTRADEVVTTMRADFERMFPTPLAVETVAETNPLALQTPLSFPDHLLRLASQSPLPQTDVENPIQPLLAPEGKSLEDGHTPPEYTSRGREGSSSARGAVTFQWIESDRAWRIV
jgi:hypothetical protein